MRFRLKQVLSAPRTRFWRGVLFSVFLVLFPGTTVYLLLTGTAGHPSELARLLFECGLLACYGALWLLVSDWLQLKKIAPTQAFWHVLVAGTVAALLALGIQIIPGGFSMPGQPASVTVHLKNALLALVVVGFCFIFVLRLRDLVRFRRTKKGERNWKLMLVFMLLSTLMGVVGANVARIIVVLFAVVPAVVLMAMNAFRISWIVHMPTRQKALAVLLGLLLLSGLAGLWSFSASSQISLHPDVVLSFLGYYSPPLIIFVSLCLIFGFLYTLSSVLSLIFHLPTSEVYRRSVDEIAAMQSLTALVREAVDFNKLAARIVATPVEAGRATAAWLTVLDYESGSLDLNIVASRNIASEEASASFNTLALYNEAASTREPVANSAGCGRSPGYQSTSKRC